jgi:hypothetical protein
MRRQTYGHQVQYQDQFISDPARVPWHTASISPRRAVGIFGAAQVVVPAAQHMQRCDQLYQIYLKYPSPNFQSDYERTCGSTAKADAIDASIAANAAEAKTRQAQSDERDRLRYCNEDRNNYYSQKQWLGAQTPGSATYTGSSQYLDIVRANYETNHCSNIAGYPATLD